MEYDTVILTAEERGVIKGVAKGKLEGRLEQLIELVRDGHLSFYRLKDIPYLGMSFFI